MVPDIVPANSEGDSVIYPSHSMRVLDTLVNSLALSILSYCFARRSYHNDLLSSRGWLALTWPRLTIILTFLTSWIFIFASSILVNGVGLSYSLTACWMGIYLCILFYSVSKVFLYCFLAEKVFVVWGAGKVERLRSPVCILCYVVVGVYIGIFVLLIVGRIAELRDDRACVIGLKAFSSIPLLTYDFFINAFLTLMFIYPLARSGFVNPKLRSVSARTLVASGAALTTSSINIAILTIMHGKQLGWICLASCCTDVTLNALVLFWVTSPRDTEASSSKRCTPVLQIIENGNRCHTPAPHTPRTTDDPCDDSAIGGDNRVNAAEERRDDDIGTVRGVGRWLHRPRGDRNEASTIEVHVTIATELEMDEGPTANYSRGSVVSLVTSEDVKKISDDIVSR